MEMGALLGAGAVALAATLWGLWGLFIRESGVSGPWSAALALTTIALAGLPLLPRRLPRERRLWAALAAIGVADAANAICYFQALERGPVATAVLTHYLAPLVVAGLSPWVLGARPRPRTWIAMAVSLGGLALLLGGATGGAIATATLGAASALGYAANVLISKRFGDRLTPSELLVWHSLISAALLWPFALGHPAPSVHGAALVLGAALLSGLTAGWLFLWGLARLPAARAGVLTYLEPLVGVLIGRLVLGEPMAPGAPLGAALILGAGLVVVTDAPAPVRLDRPADRP
jgi:drug/metabolite transporter (DMT)-like permease